MTDLVVIPACADDERRSELVAPSTGGGTPVGLNGIDYVEVDPSDHRVLRVTFLNPLPADGYQLPQNPGRISISGGTRIVGIEVVSAAVESSTVLRIEVDRGGDFSPYVLTLARRAELDEVKRSAEFSFMAACPADIDCRPRHECPPDELVEPLLDYMAKDYASFRRLLLDLLPQLNPGFVERNPADLGIALVELLAYTGDRLSYFQDAVANEAYLDTARSRISARRHARLVDYRMHDGRGAWTALHLEVTATGTLPRDTAVFTRLGAPLPRTNTLPGPVIGAGAITVDALQRDPDLADVVAFETAHEKTLHAENNEIRIHTWGGEECCLDRGTREAYLYSVLPGTVSAVRPSLADGDYLVLEEVVGPRTGARADADPAHRVLVRIDGPVDATVIDPLHARTLVDGVVRVRESGQPALPLLRVRWRRADALPVPFCISARLRDGTLARNVSVVRGNVVLADQGLTTEETATPEALTLDGRLALGRGPLTMEIRPADVRHDPITGRHADDRLELDGGARNAQPAVALVATRPAATELWEPVPDLLDSPPFEQQLVAEVDDAGRAVLRFGDGEYGRRLAADVVELRAVYRVGNGRAGNVGAETLAHVALAGPADWVTAVRNPLAARDGADPESIEQVRRYAPEAFHAEQFRAVTEEDWAEAARRLPDVSGAVASFRWTGSWHTVFIAIDPRNRTDLVDLPNGMTRLEPAFERRVRAFVARYRLAGTDIELRSPQFVPLELELEVCAARGHFRIDVARAVRDLLSARVLPNGRTGFFHPDNFTFGDPVYLSRLSAAVERVEGVDSVAVRVFKRYGRLPTGELERGSLLTGPWEIVRLDNDPSFVEHGVLRVVSKGGKA